MHLSYNVGSECNSIMHSKPSVTNRLLGYTMYVYKKCQLHFWQNLNGFNFKCNRLILSPALLNLLNWLVQFDKMLGTALHIIVFLSSFNRLLGRAMVLGSFQCRGVLLLWHMVGQGSAVLAAGAGRVGCFLYFFISSILSSFSNASSVARQLDILKYCGLGRYNPVVIVSYFAR